MAHVTLQLASNRNQAMLLRELLLANGIGCVIHGESDHTSMGTDAGFASIRVMVQEAQLEQARALLGAEVVESPPAPGDRPAEGAVCPVHELPAVATCIRCGSYLCASCGAEGETPTCEACAERSSPRRNSGMKAVAWVLLAILFGGPMLAVGMFQLIRLMGR